MGKLMLDKEKGLNSDRFCQHCQNTFENIDSLGFVDDSNFHFDHNHHIPLRIIPEPHLNVPMHSSNSSSSSYSLNSANTNLSSSTLNVDLEESSSSTDDEESESSQDEEDSNLEMSDNNDDVDEDDDEMEQDSSCPSESSTDDDDQNEEEDESSSDNECPFDDMNVNVIFNRRDGAVIVQPLHEWMRNGVTSNDSSPQRRELQRRFLLETFQNTNHLI